MRPHTLMKVFFCLLAVLPCLTSAEEAAPRRPVGISTTVPTTGRSVPCQDGFMVAYRQVVPGTTVEFEMVPIPGGTFYIGSPEAEPNRSDEEGPQTSIKVPAFWMGKYEVTWAEYKSFMGTYDLAKRLQSEGKRQVTDKNRIDAVTIPTPLYDPSYTNSIGEEARQPAVTMTQYAAKQYTKWLSLLTGTMYRLPSEAEWEYACRAGSKSAYSFGDDPTVVGEYAWYYENSDDATHTVGTKKPNAWGLYDMHGNVAELCLDQFSVTHYAVLAKLNSSHRVATVSESIAWPKKEFARIVRGGSWMDDADRLRSAARGATDDWRLEDPNLPKSPWWFTDEDALMVGFRIVRPLNAPPALERETYWKPSLERTGEDIENRLMEGRGAACPIDTQLPADAAMDGK